MNNERKEGIIIVVFIAWLMIAAYVFSDWGERHGYSTIYTTFLQAKIEINALSYEDDPLILNLSKTLFFLLIPMIYGFLRATGIVKRIFRFESVLSKLLPSATQNHSLTSDENNANDKP